MIREGLPTVEEKELSQPHPPTSGRPRKERAIKNNASLVVTYVGLLQSADCSGGSFGFMSRLQSTLHISRVLTSGF